MLFSTVGSGGYSGFYNGLGARVWARSLRFFPLCLLISVCCVVRVLYYLSVMNPNRFHQKKIIYIRESYSHYGLIFIDKCTLNSNIKTVISHTYDIDVLRTPAQRHLLQGALTGCTVRDGISTRADACITHLWSLYHDALADYTTGEDAPGPHEGKDPSPLTLTPPSPSTHPRPPRRLPHPQSGLHAPGIWPSSHPRLHLLTRCTS